MNDSLSIQTYLSDLLVRCWLLASELIAGETEDHESLVLILRVEFLKTRILWCEAANVIPTSVSFATQQRGTFYSPL